MSDDLVKRLRGWVRDIHEGSTALWAMDQDLKAAADRIEELSNCVAVLEAKLAKAVKGLEESQEEIDNYIRWEYQSDHPVHERYRQRDYAANPARIALAELKGQGNE